MSAGELVVLACWATAVLVLLTIASITSAATPRVAIRLEDRNRTIVCRVPRDAGNRWLDMGINGAYSHGVQLDGDDSDPITSRVTPPPIGCDPDVPVLTAYCQLTYVEGGHVKAALATTHLACRD